jgi:hypothetical protein
MHYHAEIFLPAGADLTNEISRRAVIYEAIAHAQGRLWDWWQIGGRYSATHLSERHHEIIARRAENWDRCHLCYGTGYRNDDNGQKARRESLTYTCNGCGQYDVQRQAWLPGPKPGWMLKWPTDWAPEESDILPVSEVRDDLGSYYLFACGQAYEDESGGESGINVKAKLVELGLCDGYLVTVDLHN